MSTVNAGTLVVTLEGRDVNLSELINKVENQMQRGTTTAKNFDRTIASLTATEKRNEAALAAYAQAQARFAEASGNSNLAVQRLVGAMQQLTPNTAAANNVLTQLQGTLNRQAAAANQAAAAQARASVQATRAAAAEAAAYQKNLSAVTNFASGFQSLIGAYFAVTQAAQLFSAAITAGNDLEKAQATFKALSGNTEQYEKNLEAARAQQQRFGGSLKDNIEGLSGFANLAKRTGIDINELANTARALAIIDPAQGFKGASIALKEFFSGDITSLARRFELPRDRLNELKELAQTDAPAAFAKLQAVFDEFGISQELLAAQANTTAVAYDKLAGSAADAFAAVGQGLAELLKGPAQQLGQTLQTVAAGINSLNQSGDQKLAIEAALITGAESADQFNQKIGQVNQQLVDGVASAKLGVLAYSPLAPLLRAIVTEGLRFEELTQAQLNFAQAALRSGQSLETIRAAIAATKTEFDNLNNAFAIAPESINATREQLDQYQEAALRAATASAEGATFANAISAAIFDQSISVEEGTEKLLGYVSGIAAMNAEYGTGLDLHERHAQGIQQITDAISEQALENLNAANTAQVLKQREEEIYAAALAAAQGMGSAGNAAVAMAQQFGIAESKAADLINMLRNLQIAQNLAGAATATEKQFVGINALAGRAVDLTAFRDQEKALKGVNDALRDQSFQAADAAGKVQLLKNELAKLAPGTEAYIRKQTELMRAEESLQKARTKGSKGTSPKLTANEKLNNQLLAQEEKFQTQMEDLEEKHQQKLLDIIEDFAKKQLEVQKQNEILKRRSRFDFYSDLNKSQLSPIDRQAFAAAYEDAFNKAQQIAQSGRAKLAQEFLSLKQEHIQQLKELAQEEAEIRSDKDLSKGEKNARLQELEERRKLLQDAQREEEKQLLEGGDKVHNELNERIADENKAYEEQADKIITAADRAGEAKIRNAERSKIAVDAENLALVQQYEQYKKIADLNGGRLPSSGLPSASTPAAVAAPPGVPAPITAPEPIPVTADTPLSVQAPEFLTVKQLELFIVRDQGVIDALGDQTARLEGKLDSLLQQLISENNNLGGKLDQIRSTIANSNRGAVRT